MTRDTEIFTRRILRFLDRAVPDTFGDLYVPRLAPTGGSTTDPYDGTATCPPGGPSCPPIIDVADTPDDEDDTADPPPSD